MIAAITEVAIIFGISYAILAIVHKFKYPVASAEELKKKRTKTSITVAIIGFVIIQLLQAYSAGMLR